MSPRTEKIAIIACMVTGIIILAYALSIVAVKL